jgi:hypothetical protein
MGFVILFAMFVNDNQEFLEKEKQLRAEGYRWESIECREPLPGQVEGRDYISQGKTDTHPGYVCNELKK